MEVTNDQFQTAQAKMAKELSDRPQPVNVNEAITAEATTEADTATAERLKEFVARSGIAVNTYMSGQVIPGEGYGLRYLESATMQPGDAMRLQNALTDYTPLVELNAQGVAEILTFTRLTNNPYLSRVPGHTGERGAVTAVTYESTHFATTDLMKLPYSDMVKYNDKTREYPTGFERGAPGASFSYNLFMLPEDAAALREVIGQQPGALHLLNEVIMTEVFGADPDGFRAKGPQYDAWRASDGGQAKLAIRDSLNADATASQIITY